MLEKRVFKAKYWLLTVITLLFLTDLSIILNIPILRPALSFLFFTIVPGLLVIQILRLNQSNPIKKAVLSVGTSISILMIVGMGLNSLYPTLINPLALNPVLITLNILIVILTATAYQRIDGKWFADPVGRTDGLRDLR